VVFSYVWLRDVDLDISSNLGSVIWHIKAANHYIYEPFFKESNHVLIVLVCLVKNYGKRKINPGSWWFNPVQGSTG